MFSRDGSLLPSIYADARTVLMTSSHSEGPIRTSPDDVDRLFLSTRRKDYDSIKALLAAGVHPMSSIPALSDAVREELHSELDRDVERGRGALHVACSMGLLREAQLLAAFGAELDTAIGAGSAGAGAGAGAGVGAGAGAANDLVIDEETPATIAVDGFPNTVGAWAQAALRDEFGKDRLMIAATARLPWAASYMLRCGWADPDVSRQGPSGARLPYGAFVEGARKQEYVGAPAPCPETARVMQLVEAAWGPKTHWLFHSGVRRAVLVVHLVVERMHRLSSYTAAVGTSGVSGDVDAQGKGDLCNGGGHAAGRSGGGKEGGCTHAAKSSLPHLPIELWLLVLSFLRRSHFAVIASTSREPLVRSYDEL